MPERKIEYETLEHKADSGLLIRAPSLARLYIDAALSMTDMMVKLDRIQEKERKTVTVSADTRENLLVRWLNEVLFLFSKEKFLAHRITFEQFDGKKLKATLSGETFDHIRHGGVSEIKAVTYHQLEVGDKEKPEPHFYARVFFDL